MSFGQGCEGEPLLQSKTLAKSVKLMRKTTSRGIVNLNTNGFSSDKIRELRDAGLDSIRISMNSPNRDRYHQYYRPKGYQFEEVMDSIRTAKRIGLFTSVNYLVFPGYTDREDEVEKLMGLVAETGIDQVQMRNLSLDPALYLNAVKRAGGKAIGVKNLIGMLKEEFPSLIIGYFNLPEKDMRNGRDRAKSTK